MIPPYMKSDLIPVIVGEMAVNCWVYPLPPGGALVDGGQPPGGAASPFPPPARQPSAPPCAVIDPGGDPDLIIARLEELSLSPQYFLLTHGHFDHLLALPALAARYKDAEIAIHRDDGTALGPGSRRIHRETLITLTGSAGDADSFLRFAGDLPPAGRFLAEGDRAGPLRTLHLPGHSPGSVAFYDEDAGLLFSGDTLFRDGVGRTDLPGGDAAKLEASLRRLFALDGGVVVCPGHGPDTTIGEEITAGGTHWKAS